jgi:nucleoside-diphosphate-sugar epimerase
MCFIRDALATGVVELRSSGRQLRNFVSTDELAQIIGTLLVDFPEGYRVVNAVSAWHTRIVDIVRMVETSWNAIHDNSLKLRILSDVPAEFNDFRVTSSILEPRLGAEQSRARMAEVIGTLIALNQQI